MAGQTLEDQCSSIIVSVNGEYAMVGMVGFPQEFIPPTARGQAGNYVDKPTQNKFVRIY